MTSEAAQAQGRVSYRRHRFRGSDSVGLAPIHWIQLSAKNDPARRYSPPASRVCGQSNPKVCRYSNRLHRTKLSAEEEEASMKSKRRDSRRCEQVRLAGNQSRKQQVQVQVQVQVPAAVLLVLSCCVLVIPPCTGQGSDCSCNETNSRCDESGLCRCDPGWGGERCERCVPMPGCLHGSCQQPWQCSCEAGWGGRFCDKDLSVCSEQQPCLNGATCVMEDSGEYTCLCPDGFHGRRCRLKTGPCHQRRSPCRNGGLCEDADGFAAALTCRCLAGFTGSRCETDVDDCLISPCANGATCVDAINRFSCLCPAGFAGRFCTVNLDDCASRPCLNGARCLDRGGGFHCICRPGYDGVTCEAALRAQNDHEHSWAKLAWEGGVRPHLTTEGKSQRSRTTNSSHHGDRLLKVTVSERGGAGLSGVQLVVLLVLAGLTVGVVVLTAAHILHGHAHSWSMTSSPQQQRQKSNRPDEQECRISVLNVAEPEKKKMNAEQPRREVKGHRLT
ncbi:protein delta homolog 2 [Brachionichthys hirsutus]|uniref:protein delta homolog 2 n=1 Tax=Brachionichthys hirsutus TaxID=412623 RepID=UPI003604C65C